MTDRDESETPPRPEPGRRSRLRGCLGRLALAAVSVVVSLLLLEGVVRLALPQQLILLRPDIWAPHDGLGWVRQGNLDTRINTGEGAVRLRTDSAGRRIGERSPVAEPDLRILALGDSFTAALQVEHEETFVALLETSLSRDLNARVDVVNTGVAGYGPSHYLRVASEELARRHHDLVLVALFLGNDVEDRRIDHFPPKEPSPVHSFRLPRAATKRELRDSFVYPVNDLLERRSHLFVLARHQARFLLMRLGLTARKFPRSVLSSEATSDRWRLTADLAADIDAVAAEHGVPTLFALIPSTYQVDEELGLVSARLHGIDPSEVDLDQPARLLRPLLESRGLAVVDATPALEAALVAGRRPHGQVDTHLSATGHQGVAETIHTPARALLAERP